MEGKVQIFVRANGRKTITLLVEGSDTVSSLMAQLEDWLGLRPIEFFISHGTGLLYYHDTGTLSDHKIRKHSTLSVLYSHTGPSTYEFKVETLRSLGVDVAHADDDGIGKKMGVFVRDCLLPCARGRRVRTIVLEVEAGDTGASVMAQVQGKLGYPPTLQALYYNDHKTRMLHDSGGMLADYKVKDGSVLILNMNYDEARPAGSRNKNYVMNDMDDTRSST